MILAAFWECEEESQKNTIEDSDATIENVVLKKTAGNGLTILSKRRDAVLRAIRGHDISQRRVRRLFGVNPQIVRRDRLLGGTDISEEMQELCPIALSRKKLPFAGHDEVGRTWACICSLIATAKINGVEFFAYLKVPLEAIAAGHAASRGGDFFLGTSPPSS